MRIAIVGAGLIGRLLGWRLNEAGHRATLFERSERDEPESAAHVAAAMLAPMSELPDSDAEVYGMGTASLPVWRQWLPELDVPHGFDGSIAVAHRTDETLLTTFERVLRARSDEPPRRLDRRALDELEPGLAPTFTTGLFLPGEGWIDNRALLEALATRCGDIRYGQSAALDDGDAIWIHRRRAPVGVPAEFDAFIDCRGAGADEPGLRRVRGEVVRLRAPEVTLRRPIRLMHPRYQLYVAPRTDDEYVVGATQIESDSEAPVTVRSALELLSAAFSLHTGFAEAEILGLDSGLRAAFDDNVPRVYWRDGILRVNGLYRHGFLVAPAIVQAILNEIDLEEGGCSSASMAS